MQKKQQSPQLLKLQSSIRTKNKSNMRAEMDLVTIHQLDCIYYGQINKSYHKEGFGILQTLDFQTYVGFWSNGKASGIGLVIYPGGQVIYGQFVRNRLNGVGVVDNKICLKVGVFQGINIIGIGYQYTYSTKTWSMKKYNNKGLPISLIKQQSLSLEDGIPEMITTEHTVYQFFKNYVEATYFNLEDSKWQKSKKKDNKIVNKNEVKENKYAKMNEYVINIEKNEKHICKIGFRDENGFYGLCCVIDKQLKAMKQCGFYRNGQFHGYGFVNNGNQQTIGPYIEGSKQGIFVQYREKLCSVNQYQFNQCVWPSQISEQQAKKKQMKYNFEQKDFLSAKNPLETSKLSAIFQSPETRLYELERDKAINGLKTPDNKPQIRQSLSRENSSKKQFSASKSKSSYNFLPEKNDTKLQRSCITIMRQKMDIFDVLGIQTGAREKSASKRKNLLNSNLKLFADDEQSIAVEENPFDNVIHGYNTLNSSSRKRS